MKEAGTGIMNTPRIPWYFSPFTVTIIAIAQCLLKGTLKIVLGLVVRSPMIIGSGLHDFGDSVQEVMLFVGLILKKKQVKGFPYGLKELETALTGFIVAILILTAWKIGSESFVGLVAQLPGGEAWGRAHLRFLATYEPVRVEPGLLIPLVSLMAGSVVISLGTSWLQIRAGTINKEAAITADGKETRSDAVVEFVGLLGVLAVQLAEWRAAEYILGLAVTGFVVHTAWEIARPTIDIFLKRSLGEEVEESITKAVLAVHGVESVIKLLDHRIGSRMAVCNLTIVTRLGSARHSMLQYAVERAARLILMKVDGIEETAINVVIQAPANEVTRIAYACAYESRDLRIVTKLSEATHLLVCDVVRGDPSKGRIRPYKIEGRLDDFVIEKHVYRLYMYFGRERIERGEEPPAHIHYTLTDNPETELGVSLSS